MFRHLIFIAIFSVPVSFSSNAYASANLQFEDCTLTSENGISVVEAQCAQFEVAENFADPDGRKISLSVAKIPARASKPEADPIVFLAGGPGQSALSSYHDIRSALDSANAKRDILLIDQRGTGESAALKCDLADIDATQQPSPQQLADMAQACVEKYQGKQSVGFYRTEDAVRDLETIRMAMGGVQFNLIGGSYGTRVALHYLRRFPEGVRSVVIDGVAPPQEALGQEHALNLNSALNLIFDACVADAACKQRFGDPKKTLAELRLKLTDNLPQVTVYDRVTHKPEQQTLSEDILAGVMRFYAYVPQFATLTPLLLDEARAGNAQPIIAQARMLQRNLEDMFAYGMQLSVMCSEDVDLFEAKPEYEKLLIGNALITTLQTQCAHWPTEPRAPDFHDVVESDKPILVLSGEWDPVTPPRYGEMVMPGFSHARHIVVRGQGHIVMNAGCMPKLLGEFFSDLKPDELDTACLDALDAPAFFTSFNGSAP